MRRLYERDADLAAEGIRMRDEFRVAAEETFAAVHVILECHRPASVRIDPDSHFQAGMAGGDIAHYLGYAATGMADLQAKAVSTGMSGRDRGRMTRHVRLEASASVPQ